MDGIYICRSLWLLLENVNIINDHEMVEGSEALVIDLTLAGDASGEGGYLVNVRLPVQL